MKKKLYIETYGCQMNIVDSEIVVSILSEQYQVTTEMNEADLFLINTCSVREHAEQRIRKRLRELNALKKRNPYLIVGLLGCMAERLKEQLLNEEATLDIIVGPDAYRTLPQLIEEATIGKHGVNVLLSKEETYDDIVPVRYDSNHVSAFISIMRGCNNFCSYCVVPYTRGRERSRDPETILQEAEILQQKGYKDITLLGQNVNSYRWNDHGKEIYFAQLIELIAQKFPNIWIRFATSHPKDISDDLIDVIAKYDHVCKHIHLPVQTGSNNMLRKMNRVYTREYYLERIKTIKAKIQDCSITTDLIIGFCGEKEADHQETLSIMQEVGYSSAFMFKYSVRENTKAAKEFENDVTEQDKSRRFNEVLDLQQQLSLESNQKDIGKTFTVLVEGVSKRSEDHLFGRNSQNKVVVFPKNNHNIGDFVSVTITQCTPATLIAE
ncbi:MAG: tRNA (N6-isopentenyl adenosine(37)-C2)-methylthiotransferase MiaB [Bacteroidales bacterium]|jgi:tRNA-2-methylthio-N6-dimethylallyladenosine synthase|nr:tRNA (N6-isopentenyl adenosine(37)-C2)-methylthiotransferase MiaB [Bacteroidales bacterium]